MTLLVYVSLLSFFMWPHALLTLFSKGKLYLA